MADKISIVVPVYNEAAGISSFYTSIKDVLAGASITHYQLIFCDDGSTDNTPDIIRELASSDKHLRLICFSRNFGKEAALAAGIAQADGDAILTIDGDGQHPVELIPEFIEKWRAGTQVVIGVRKTSASDRAVKRWGSRLFYSIFNALGTQQLIPGSTDYRLIDKAVQKAFLKLGETERITRGLIDWLGFRREFVYFSAKERVTGKASYGTSKLFKLASDSIVSLSPVPLYISGGLGLLITPLAFLLGIIVLFEQVLLDDPLNWNFTGTAMLGILIVFLVGIVLVSQGILSLYISHIHTQSKQRPLYIIDEDSSTGLDMHKAQ